MHHRETAKDLVAKMTLDEKASLCSGSNFWETKAITRLNLPGIMMTDGPHGLRKQETEADQLGLHKNIPATCFPTASATACSFDKDLLFEIGKAIGEECRQENISVLLGPGINIKRSPLCGRNFEYFSEDPVLSGELAVGFILGLQSQNVGASLKHFAANNQERRRFVSESVMDERTFREIYLKGFEIAVKKAKPWTIMCSYNRLFGEYASQNKYLLTDILRKEWGFEGAVVSDWGAIVQRVEGMRAGLDLEMPFIDSINDKRIKDAVENGNLDQSLLDETTIRLVELVLRASDCQPFTYSVSEHRALARRAASQSAVLLKNEGGILPGRMNAKSAIIGAFARFPRYQGTGSSKVTPIRLHSPFDEMSSRGCDFEYADGYRMDTDLVDEGLIHEACRVAEGKDIVYLFAGLPDWYEAESYDRDSMSMPENHLRLIDAVCKVNPNIAVILLGGAPMELPWEDQVPGILMMYLGGEACGEACVDLLLGDSNPCGKLAESWPLLETDNPSFGNFPGYPSTVEYREGIFVGYRYYDSARKEVRYPFGYGLSYTTFAYDLMQLSTAQIHEDDSLTITCRIKNTGNLAGSEIVQLYVSCRGSGIPRPEQELKGFEKVNLDPGAEKVVQFILSASDLAYFDPQSSSWNVESGTYEIRIAASSRDIRLTSTVQVDSDGQDAPADLRAVLPAYFDLSNGLLISDKEFTALLGRPLPPRERKIGSPHTINSTFTDIQDNWLGRQMMKYMKKKINNLEKSSPGLKQMAEKMMLDLPLRFLTMMSASGSGSFSIHQVEGLVEVLNGHIFKGIRMLLNKKKGQGIL